MRARHSHTSVCLPICPRSQYVIKTVEVESSKTKQALSESQARNQHLQEQVAMQRQVLKEMEQQLQSSHQLTAQLRAQVRGSSRGCWGGMTLGSPCDTVQRLSTWGSTDTCSSPPLPAGRCDQGQVSAHM